MILYLSYLSITSYTIFDIIGHFLSIWVNFQNPRDSKTHPRVSGMGNNVDVTTVVTAVLGSVVSVVRSVDRRVVVVAVVVVTSSGKYIIVSFYTPQAGVSK